MQGGRNCTAEFGAYTLIKEETGRDRERKFSRVAKTTGKKTLKDGGFRKLKVGRNVEERKHCWYFGYHI